MAENLSKNMAKSCNILGWSNVSLKSADAEPAISCSSTHEVIYYTFQVKSSIDSLEMA